MVCFIGYLWLLIAGNLVWKDAEGVEQTAWTAQIKLQGSTVPLATITAPVFNYSRAEEEGGMEAARGQLCFSLPSKFSVDLLRKYQKAECAAAIFVTVESDVGE